MVAIEVDYTAMHRGEQGLVDAWQRIEGHLAELDRAVAGTHDMQADALSAYRALKVRWTESAAERQLALRSLSDLLAQASEHYRRVDAALAAQFGG